MPAFDAELMFRTTGALTQDESLGPVVVYGGIVHGLAARVVVPTANGANDTIQGKIYRSTDGSTYHLIAQWAKGNGEKPGSTGLEMIIPFPVLPGKQYVKLELDGTAASTTYNFGTVVAGVIENPGHDYDRSSGSFH